MSEREPTAGSREAFERWLAEKNVMLPKMIWTPQHLACVSLFAMSVDRAAYRRGAEEMRERIEIKAWEIGVSGPDVAELSALPLPGEGPDGTD